MPKIKEIPDLNTGCFLVASDFPQVKPPTLSADHYHLIRYFEDSPALYEALEQYYHRQGRVEPVRFADELKSARRMVIELRRIAQYKGGDSNDA